MILTFDEIAETEIPLPHDRLDTGELLGQPGSEHYRLLAYLARQFSHGTIIDIGTHIGCSALALSTNPSNRVYTFDLQQKLSVTDQHQLWTHGNVVFSKDNLMESETRQSWRDILLSSSLIVLDIDPHEGSQEFEFYEWLKQENYRGLLLLDDIHYFKGMRDNCWYKIPSEEKRDLTGLGHWSGTGLVRFDRDEELLVINPHFHPRLGNVSVSSTKKWTVVTAFFDLTKRPDANEHIRKRDSHHYLDHAAMTMAIDQPLVLYCDPEMIDQFRSMRPVHLLKQTRFIPIEFDDLDFVRRYYDRVVAARKTTGYNADPRNTPSYYLFCMIRYELLMRTMSDNPFDATHFAWCNICIERMNWRNMIFFPSIWQEFRQKFSTCYIDYQPESLVIENPKIYYQYGRCGMCSGFFTGSRSYMLRVCEEMVRAFVDMLEMNLGHADEQLLSIVYFRHPSLFQFYIGDYQEMIVNYGWINENPQKPIRNFFKNLYKSGEQRPLLYSTTRQWLVAHSLGSFQAAEDIVQYVRQLNQFAQSHNKTLVG